jgi:hypothetical protein
MNIYISNHSSSSSAFGSASVFGSSGSSGGTKGVGSGFSV